MLRQTLFTSLALLAALLLSACAVREAAPSVFADFDQGTDFSGYETFAWANGDPVIVTAAQPLTKPTSRVTLLESTESALRAKGIRRVKTPEEADFIVSFVLGTEDSLQENNFPGRFRQVGQEGVVYGETSEVREVSPGVIFIEFADGRGQRTWTGWATTGLTMDVYANSEDKFREMVTLILEQFPPVNGQPQDAG